MTDMIDPLVSEYVRHIVIVRTDHIGDAVMTIPLIRETKKLFPHAKLDLVLSDGVVSLFKDCPYADRIIPVKARVLRYADSFHQFVRMWRLRREYFSDKRPDLVFSPRRGPDADGTALVAWATGAKTRIAFRKGRHFKPMSAFFHDECFTDLIDLPPPAT